MLIIKNILMPDGSRQDLTRELSCDFILDGSSLLAIPGLIDPHVHFRVPGLEHKEDWIHGAKAAIKGGYTQVFDMPNTIPATTTEERLQAKKALINQQLQQANIPLKYKLFFGADKNQFQEIHKVKDQIVGIKVFMGASTGDLLMDDLSSLHAIYALAKTYGLLIALHAEDELIIRENLTKYKDAKEFKYHSIIRSKEAAYKAVELVIELSELYQVPSYILHLSTKKECELILEAKKRGVKVYAETCPHYLFLNTNDYDSLKGLAKMNPPLRESYEQEYLWEAINAGVIDTLASDHAPHTLSEKEAPFCRCPSGIPGVETSLPLLLTAYMEGKISLERILALTHYNPQKIFKLDEADDLVLVDIVNYKIYQNQDVISKCGWSPYRGRKLTGFPRYVYLNEVLIDVTT